MTALIAVSLALVVVLGLWVEGLTRRLDRLENLLGKCETAIAQGKHIKYEGLDTNDCDD